LLSASIFFTKNFCDCPKEGRRQDNQSFFSQ